MKPALVKPGLFRNRREAGRLLAEKLAAYANRPDVLVLALPRGGVPVAYEVANALGAPLDVFIVRKLGVPGYEELAMGAVATGGVRVLNDQIVDRLGIPDQLIDAVAAREQQELSRRERLYRGGRLPRPDHEDGKSVADAPKCSNQSRPHAVALIADDGRDGNNVIRIGGVAHPQKKSHGEDGEKPNHALHLELAAAWENSIRQATRNANPGRPGRGGPRNALNVPTGTYVRCVPTGTFCASNPMRMI